jgi:hypothetical protein
MDSITIEAVDKAARAAVDVMHCYGVRVTVDTVRELIMQRMMNAAEIQPEAIWAIEDRLGKMLFHDSTQP